MQASYGNNFALEKLPYNVFCLCYVPANPNMSAGSHNQLSSDYCRFTIYKTSILEIVHFVLCVHWHNNAVLIFMDVRS